MKAKATLVLGMVLFLLASCERLENVKKALRPDEIQMISSKPSGLLEKPEDLELQFSREAAPPDQVGSTLDPALIRIEPELERYCKWHSPSVVRCYLRGFTPGTSYRAEVSRKIIPPETKLKLVGDRSFSFQLEGLRVRDISFTYLPNYDPPQMGLVINFNQEVARDDLEPRLKILAPDGAALPFHFEYWTGANTSIKVETYLNGYNQKSWKAITAEIEAGLPNRARNSTLEQPYRQALDLPAGGSLKITKVSTEQRGQTAFIQVCFSNAVASETLPKFLKLEPEKEYRIENEYRCSNLIGSFLPGESYTLTLKKGLTGQYGDYLDQDFSQSIKFPDLEPSISLIGDGHYLPRQGEMNLGIETVNRDKVVVKVKRIFSNNLIYFLAGGAGEGYCGQYDYESEEYLEGGEAECGLARNLEVLGKEILKKEIPVQPAKNKIVTTVLPVEELVGPDRQGIYAVGVYRNKDSWYADAFVWLIATDLGLIAHRSDDRLLVMVRSLESLLPVAGARVKLFSKNNQLLVEGRTDGQGLVQFSDLAETFKEFIPYLIVAEKGDDFSFLAFSQAGVNTSSFDVSGDPFAGGSYEAYLYPERDIYRPGETAHLAYLIRDRDLKVPESFPVTLQVKSPDQRLFLLLKSRPEALASGEFELSFPPESLTGAYSVELYGAGEKPIGSTRLRIEEFMPDRIKVVLSTEQERYPAGEDIAFSVQANYLFGPPAAGRRVKGSCYLEERGVGFPAYPEFVFGDAMQERMKPIELSLGEKESDAGGQAGFTCTVPKSLRPQSGGLSATAQATVFEPGGGRAVSGRKMLAVDPFPVYVGSRRDFKKEPSAGEKAEFSVLALDPQGKPAAGRELVVSWFKIEWNTVLKRDGNRYRYESERKKNLVHQETLTSAGKPGQVSFASPSYGSYAIEVEDKASGARSLQQFYFWGWGYSPWAMENPDRIELTLDRPEYLPGESASVLVQAPFSGKLILFVVGDALLDSSEYDLAENTATLPVPVREAYRPNVYVVATLLRSFKSAERFAPLRAVGIVPLRLSSKPDRLEVQIRAPEQVRPNRQVEVTIQVSGGAGGRVSLAAVDEGILSLTGFATPDPLSYFYRKRRLPFAVYDLYSMILPEVAPAPPRSPFGGGIDQEKLKRELAPLSVKRVKPVSLWSGLQDLDADGKAKISLEVPQFNGTLRLMALAFTRDKMGGAQAPLIARDPITITSSLPRFLAPGDSFVIPVTVMNGTGQRDNFTLSLETEGKVQVAEAKKSAFLEKDGETTQRFQAQTVPSIGKDKITIRAAGAGQTSVEQTEIAIRPPYPLYSKTDVLAVTEAKPASFEFPKDWVPGTQAFKLTASKAPALKYAESLKYLLGYPYGCIEQTTSKAFPLLYFNDLARFAAPDLFQEHAVDYWVNEAITKLIAMNFADGSFSYWPGESSNAYPWSSVYATHFLVEAKKAGYNVPEIILDRSLDYLRNFTNTRKLERDYYWRCREVAYALYVLALAEKPNHNVMDWMVDSKVCEPEKDLEMKSLLAGAYLAVGDEQTAERLLPVGGQPAGGEIETGGCFYSPARAEAWALNILATYRPNHPAIPGLVKALTDRAAGGRWFNTQANAFAFLALGKYCRGQEQAQFTGVIALNGEKLADFDPSGLTLAAADWGGKKAEIKLAGPGTAYVYWEASGIPLAPPAIQTEDHGLKVRKQYLNEDGDELDLQKVPQGSLVIVKLTLSAPDRGLGNVVMADLLPAGLEIENPRLLTTAPPEWIVQKTGRPQYLDIRDDRMLTFQDLSPNSDFHFYYALRAVTVGDFVLPPVKAEAMYDPSFRSLTAAGRIQVVERQ